jgi:hypothetical protein
VYKNIMGKIEETQTGTGGIPCLMKSRKKLKR